MGVLWVLGVIFVTLVQAAIGAFWFLVALKKKTVNNFLIVGGAGALVVGDILALFGKVPTPHGITAIFWVLGWAAVAVAFVRMNLGTLKQMKAELEAEHAKKVAAAQAAAAQRAQQQQAAQPQPAPAAQPEPTTPPGMTDTEPAPEAEPQTPPPQAPAPQPEEPPPAEQPPPDQPKQ